MPCTECCTANEMSGKPRWCWRSRQSPTPGVANNVRILQSNEYVASCGFVQLAHHGGLILKILPDMGKMSSKFGNGFLETYHDGTSHGDSGLPGKVYAGQIVRRPKVYMCHPMYEYELHDYESDTFDSSEEDVESESTSSLLNFCSKVSDELRLCFRRNCESEDFCDDIYDVKFETPRSGSHSYYSDILAVAQLNEKNDGGPYSGTITRDYQRSDQQSMVIHPSNWICTGQWNPTTGAGPFEELFKVLEDHHTRYFRPINNNPSVSSLMYYPQEWETSAVLPSPYDDELIGITSMNSDYPSFIDSFHRWSNNSCAMLPSANQNTFMPHEYHSSF